MIRAIGVVIFLLSAIAMPSCAQESHWNELIEHASSLRDQGKYAEGIPVAEDAVQVAESTFGPDHQNLALSLNLLGVMYDYQGRYAEAEPLYKRSLAIREKLLGAEHPDVAISLNNLAFLYEDQGRYVEAESLYKRSLAIYEKSLGPEHLDVAMSVNNLAAVYEDQGKYAEAEPLYKRSLEIREKALGPGHLDVAMSLNNLALLFQKQGRYAEAEPLYKRSLTIHEKTLRPDNPEVAKSLNNLAFLYEGQGKYAEAEPLYKRSLAIYEKALGPDHPNVATSLNNLALLYRDQGKYSEAESLYKRSLAIYEKSLGQDHPEVAASLNNLAGFYRAQGKHADAEPLYKRSLAIYEKALGPDHADVANSLNNLALLYRDQGRYAEAEPLYQRSLSIREKALGPDHPDVANSLNSVVAVYENQGKYVEAEPLSRRSLAILEKALGADHPDVAASLNNLAAVYEDQGKYAETEPLYKRSLAIREKALGPDHPDVAMSLNNLAFLYQNEGEYAEAESLYKRSLAIRERILGADHPDMATSLNNLATLYSAQGKYGQAEAFFERALQNLSKQFETSFTYLSEKDRLQFLDTVRFDFDLYLSFCLTHGQNDPALVGRMYDLLLWEKGLVGTSAAALRAQVAASGDADAIKIFDRLAAKKSESARLSSTHPEGWQQVRKSVDSEANDLEQQLARRVTSVVEQKGVVHASWREVQKKLEPGEAAVELVRFRFHDGKRWTPEFKYAALVVTPLNLASPTLVSLGEAKDLEAGPLREYRLRVGLRADRAATAVSGADENIGSAPKLSLFDAIWRPIESALHGARRIYLSPDGVLNQVALGDLTGDDGLLLLEKYDLRIVSSTKDILRAARKHQSNTAVLVGNPAFSLDVEQQRDALRLLSTTPMPVTIEVASMRSRDLRGATLNALPGTQVEVQAIQLLLEKQLWKVESFTRSRALKESVLRVKSPRVLHIATHGFFEADQKTNPQQVQRDEPSGTEDPMLRSGLFFAGANRHLSGVMPPEDLDDGVLTAYEASQLNLHGTELVVLSACETGLGEVADGEGVFGLRRALQVAGAESMMMSMWAVPDEETRDLMTLFYTKWLSGKDKHAALREAQLEMRARVKARYGKDLPRYWGAFVLVGP